ncbi:MAG: acetate--CoA ligase [Pelotomaculum sp.]|uniref:Acetyl-coenzyme A synthetase n=1 Tax=Pelotomaculum thermopropionicum (strain DSM 13744 / JCM 10971 / SI) TaxID=370438 RepID=A5D0C3_PELTS|nr:acetate--CoA ligase [Pelotomaculum sp.]BAF60312.1 acyl-coenzyme A synthetases/AMP-(fatty) acid ligases [Pelotomaculum thermopropionicum SI]
MKAEKTGSVESLLTEKRIFSPSSEFAEKALLKSRQQYEEMWRRSIEKPDEFWAEMAEKHIDWFKKWDAVEEYSFKDDVFVRYFRGAKLNASYNCLDRHLNNWRRNKAALIWQGEPAEESRTYTYLQLHREVCKFASVLKSLGVKKGDRVTVYMPMIPELVITLLACARIGAIHSVVFGGFSSEALRDRIIDSQAETLVTANFGLRAGKTLNCKENADEALSNCPAVKNCIVVRRIDRDCNMMPGRDYWWHELMSAATPACEPEQMDAEDPLFILYTSGSTGKPKGVMHTTGGYMVYATTTFKYIFDYRDEDVFWCTADIGWVTGHSYIVYGPLSAGATSLMFEGVPNYPQPDRFWEVVEKYRVNIFYTAPTAIRAMMRDGDRWPLGRDLSSLRLLGTVGEPINPEAWMWYYKVVGKERCPVVDTWWQTETGGILISPLPGCIPTKPGSATVPFFGVNPKIIRQDGSEAAPNEGGYLVIDKPWPGIMRGVYGDPNRFKNTYFVQYPGYYFTGDGARRDEDGYFWLMGRVDDVINVSGHRLGTAEVESSLVAHPKVAEAAVVGFPHEIKGEGIYAYVTVKEGVEATEELKKELIAHVRKEIGPIASPDKIQFSSALPKTRSGKIIRRILRKIAAGEIGELGDTTTLADPAVVESLVAGRLEAV